MTKLNEKHEHQKKFRKELPIFQKRAEIVEAVKAHQVILISGDTGCGKTTQVAQYLHEEGLAGPKLIGITQPRRIAAMTISQRVAEESNCTLGALVGYEIRFESKMSKETKIKFMTDGILQREITLDFYQKQYGIIIIDEAHERGVNSDVLLGLIKRLLKQRGDLRIIVMSATLETEKIIKFFKKPYIISIHGRFHPIEIYNSIEPQRDYLDGCLNTILQIHFNEKNFENKSNGDILVFLTGQEEIEDLEDMLKEKVQQFKKSDSRLLIRPLYAAQPPHQQLKAFEKCEGDNERKVILSTNIAETSVTIDGVKFVVDCGFVKIRYFEANKALESLLTIPIAKSSSIQRAGRAGRQEKGKCFRIYPKEAYETLDDYTMPEILRSDMCAVILQQKAVGVDNILEFPFIDKPDEGVLKISQETLQKMGAIDALGILTPLGKEILELPLEPLYGSALLKCLSENDTIQQDFLSIIALLNVENQLYTKKEDRNKIGRAFNRFKMSNSDHLTKLALLSGYVSAKNRNEFCKEYCVNKRAIEKVVAIREQLRQILNEIKQRRLSTKKGANNNLEGGGLEKPAYKKINQSNMNFGELLKNIEGSHDFDQENLLKVLGRGFASKIAKLNTDGSYSLAIGAGKAWIHPESVVFYSRVKPKCVVYNMVVTTKKTYLRDVSEIKISNN